MARRRIEVEKQDNGLWSKPVVSATLHRRPLVELLQTLGPASWEHVGLRFNETGLRIETLVKNDVWPYVCYRLPTPRYTGQWPTPKSQVLQLSGRQLFHALRYVPDVEVGLVQSGATTVTVQTSTGSVGLPALWQDYVRDVADTPIGVFRLYCTDLSTSLANAIPFACYDSRQWSYRRLSLVSFELLHEQELAVQASDAKVMGRTWLNYAPGQVIRWQLGHPSTEGSLGLPLLFRAPATDLRRFQRFLRRQADVMCDLILYPQQLVFTGQHAEDRSADWEYHLPRSQERFPDFNKVITPTQSYVTCLRTTTTDLLEALQCVAGIMTPADMRPVEFRLTEQAVSLHASAGPVHASSRLAGVYAGPVATVRYDANYLLRILRGSGQQPVLLRFGESIADDALRLELPDANAFYLLMPTVQDAAGVEAGVGHHVDKD